MPDAPGRPPGRSPVLAIPGAAKAAAETPWRAAGEVRDALFDAQTELIVGTRATAEKQVARGVEAYRGPLRAGIRSADPAADKAVLRSLAAARTAVARGDSTALAGARGAARAAILRGSYAATLAAVDRGDADAARGWLLLREFRTATRFTRPGADATIAVGRLGAGKLDAGRAHAAVQKDLLDAYQARLRELLGDAQRGAENDLPARRAEAAAQAQGYFEILAARYTEDRGADATQDARAAYAELTRTAASKDVAAFSAARDRAAATLEGFTAAPFTAEEAARRAQQLLRFLALVPVEYGRGVKGTRVNLDFEIQEAAAFHSGASAAFADLRDQLAKRDQARTDAAAAGIDKLGALVGVATKQKEGVPETDEIEGQTKAVEDALERHDARGLEGEHGRVGLRPHPAHARPHAGGGRRRPVPPGRAGAPGGVLVLRVRSGAAAEGIRPRPGAHDRGPDLVRRARRARLGQADREPRARARAARGPPRARHQARGRRGDARRQLQQRHRGHQLGDPRVPRGPGGRAHPRRHHRVVRRRPPAGCASRCCGARCSACSPRS